MSTFDVWVMQFEPGEAPPAERLQAAFGLDMDRARALERGVPKVVKHAVPAKAAGEMRQALEAIGAVVECRPARRDMPSTATDPPAVFRPPDPDLLVAERVSAIDPFAPPSAASVPRISVDYAVPPVARPKPERPEVEEPRRRIGASLMATSRAQQRRVFMRQAIGSSVAGVAIILIGWLFGTSVLQGEAGFVGIAFDGLGIYFFGVGLYDFVETLRS